MRLLMIVAAVTATSACTNEPSAPEYWGRDDGRPASDADKLQFGRDEAACEYDMAKTLAIAPNRPVATMGAFRSTQAVLGSAMLSGPAPGSFDLCMRVRGWARKS